MKRQKGFTLIELLVVITILGVLAAIGLTSYKTANMKARDSRRAADVQQLRSALEMYKTDNGVYPLNADYPGVLQTYLSGQAVLDPKTKLSYSYDSPTGATYTLTYTPETGPSPTPIIFSNP